MLLNNDWSALFYDEFEKDYFIFLKQFIENEYKNNTIFPQYENIFRAFNLLKLDELKVIIIGQDPYHGLNQANGLAFSVCDKCKIPPSLQNIYRELMDDINCALPANGNLEKWAEQGVLLINSVLTVQEAKPNSHKEKGWEIFTDTVIKKISEENENIVFILWGATSQKKEKFIDSRKHFVIKSAHPSPLSAYRGFFGSKPFSKTNNYLREYKKQTIDWCLTPQQSLL